MFGIFKGRLGVYLVVIVAALVVRGMSAPVAYMSASRAVPNPSKQPEQPPRSELFEFADTAKKGAVAAMNARAVYLYQTAQQQPDPIGWLDQHFRTTAGDIAVLKQQYGAPTGSAEQFSQTTNRTAELAAVSLALDWARNGKPDLSKVAVNLDPILIGYGKITQR